MKVAVIPARGRSKRIPRKNIMPFHGKPMIAWSIEAALRSECFDMVLVSTDDDEIAEIALKFGAEVPFKRPARISDDFATTVDVMAHATHWLKENFSDIEAICCIYPTAPFIDSNDLVNGFAELQRGDWQYAFSVTKFEPSVFRSFTQNSSGGIEMIFPEYYEARSQDLPESLHDAAQFYWGKPAAWLENMPIFANYAFPIRIPNWRVIDIDHPDDMDKALALAPTIFRRLSI